MVQCPRCLESIPVSKEIFRKDSRCVRCGAELRVSPTDARVLSVLSGCVGIGILFAVRVRVLDFILLVVPMWLLVLSVMVRVVPMS